MVKREIGPGDSTPPDGSFRPEPVTRSFLERLAPRQQNSLSGSVALGASLIGAATASAATIDNPLQRAVLQLAAGILVFLVGLFTRSPGTHK